MHKPVISLNGDTAQTLLDNALAAREAIEAACAAMAAAMPHGRNFPSHEKYVAARDAHLAHMDAMVKARDEQHDIAVYVMDVKDGNF